MVLINYQIYWLIGNLYNQSLEWKVYNNMLIPHPWNIEYYLPGILTQRKKNWCSPKIPWEIRFIT